MSKRNLKARKNLSFDIIRPIRKSTLIKKPRRYRQWFLWGFLLLSMAVILAIGADFVFSKIKLVNLFKNGKYLVLFQNNAELRSSGGFIGSYAVVEVENFEVQKITFNTNIYTLDRAFAQNNFVEPPPALSRMLKGETWALRDANYDASFPEAAQDISQFYQRETGDKIDGIIALNAKVVVDLLKMTGPINLNQSNLVITADNFYQETQYQVEKAYYDNPENWVLNEPKTILKDLYPEILNRALINKLAFFQLIKREIQTKEIIFYFNNHQKQAVVEKENWAGKVFSDSELKKFFPGTSGVDYLYINSNSYSGNKSSLSIKHDIDYKLQAIQENGQDVLRANLKISRIHTGSYEWPDGKNTTWMRIFMQPSSKFVDVKLNDKDISSGVEMGTENGKNFVGVEIVTEPGEINILELSYLIPDEKNYHLLVQKQPGEIGNALTINFNGKLLYEGIVDRDIKIQNE